MACSMSITGVTGIPATPGGSTTSTIHVTGTLTGVCTPIVLATGSFNVVVEVDCGAGPASTATRSSGGNWAVDIATACRCGANIVVRAYCATDPSCIDTFTGPLQCDAGDCPVGTVTVAAGACGSDGKRAVTLTANLTAVPPGSVVGQWNYGDGTLGAAFVIPGPGSYTEGPHPYTPPGPFTAQLVFVLPAGCPPLTATVSGLQPCAGPPCPQIVSATASAAGVCNADGTRTVSLNATLSGGPAQTYHWEFGTPGGASATIDATLPGATPAVSHDYPAPGAGTSSYTATFTVTGPDPSCVDTVAVAVDVAGCGGPCPTVGNVIAAVGACTPAGTRPVALDATVTGGGATEYRWDFGDGTSQVIDATVVGDPATSHDYAAPGSYTATITLRGPVGCPDGTASATFDVPACGGGDDDDDDGGSGLCGSLLFIVGALIAIATAATIFTLAWQTCPMLAVVPVPPFVWGIVVGLWVAVVAALVIWALLCAFGICDCPSGCDWAAIAWIAALAGWVVALYLAGCCGGLWWLLVAGLIAAYLAAFGYWLAECGPSSCLVLDLLLVALSSVAAVAIAYMAAVPIILACGFQWVAIGVTTVIAILAAAAAICHQGP
jgi:hypothetical protein